MITFAPPVYIPHLREWVRPWRDLDDYPFVPLSDQETPAERELRMRQFDHASRYGHQFWLVIPPPGDPAYDAYHAHEHDYLMRDLSIAGYWDIERDRTGATRPVAPVIRYARSEFPEHALLAHVVHRAKLFPSVAEARRNGWNKPIACGLYLCGSAKRRIEIVDNVDAGTAPQTIVTIEFEQGDPIKVHAGDEDDPFADWSCWCREWDGEKYTHTIRSFPRTKMSDAIRQSQHVIEYAFRYEPTLTAKGLGEPAQVLNTAVRQEIIIPCLSRHDDPWPLALQVEASRASIRGEAPRKIRSIHVGHT